MTRCMMKKSHYKSWCERMKYAKHSLCDLARQKGAELRVVQYWPHNFEPMTYRVFPPGIKTIDPYDIKDPHETRKFLEKLPNIKLE